MTSLADLRALGGLDSYLAIVSTLRADATIQSSLVNAGVLTHPMTGIASVGFVTYGRVKLANLRARPQVAVTFRAGWHWATAEGAAEIIGPDDPHPAIDAERLRLLLRAVFESAGGTHDDWDAYDRAMVDERRAAVFVTPARIYGN